MLFRSDRVKKPKEFLAGNHEVIYHRNLSSTGRLIPADPYERGLHLQTYEKTFGPLYHSRKLGQYFLVFLSPATLESKYALIPGSKLDTPRNYAQPAKKLHQLLTENPQVLLWVSGHTHTSPKNPSFNNPVNKIPGTEILDVHNPTWDGKQVWTNSLYLYPEKIEIRTYSHKKHQWLPQMNRTVPVPGGMRKGV